MGRRHRPCSAIVEEVGVSLPQWHGSDMCHIGVEEVGASHLSSVGSRSVPSGLDASVGNKVGAGSTRIQADRAEQPWMSNH